VSLPSDLPHTKDSVTYAFQVYRGPESRRDERQEDALDSSKAQCPNLVESIAVTSLNC
jgi:hypothetical protein